MKIKKLLAMLLIVVLSFALVACGNNSNNDKDNDKETSSEKKDKDIDDDDDDDDNDKSDDDDDKADDKENKSVADKDEEKNDTITSGNSDLPFSTEGSTLPETSGKEPGTASTDDGLSGDIIDIDPVPTSEPVVTDAPEIPGDDDNFLGMSKPEGSPVSKEELIGTWVMDLEKFIDIYYDMLKEEFAEYYDSEEDLRELLEEEIASFTSENLPNIKIVFTEDAVLMGGIDTQVIETTYELFDEGIILNAPDGEDVDLYVYYNAADGSLTIYDDIVVPFVKYSNEILTKEDLTVVPVNDGNGDDIIDDTYGNGSEGTDTVPMESDYYIEGIYKFDMDKLVESYKALLRQYLGDSATDELLNQYLGEDVLSELTAEIGDMNFSFKKDGTCEVTANSETQNITYAIKGTDLHFYENGIELSGLVFTFDPKTENFYVEEEGIKFEFVKQ